MIARAWAVGALAASAACSGAPDVDGGRAAVVAGAREYGYDARGLPAGSADVERDALGRVVRRGDVELVWGPDGQVAAAIAGGGDRTEYLYDERGQRLAARRGGVFTGATIDGVRLTPDAVDEPVVAAGRVLGRVRDGRFALTGLDARASVLADAAGALAPAGPFGERAAPPAHADAIDFAGAPSDEVLGLVRLGVRDYDPATRMFTSPDPLVLERPELCLASPVDCSLYAYARNRPADFVDPGGEFPSPAAGGMELKVDWQWVADAVTSSWKAQHRLEVEGEHLSLRYDTAGRDGIVNGALEWRALDGTVIAEIPIRSGNKSGNGALPPRTDYTVYAHRWSRADKAGYLDSRRHGWTIGIAPERLPDGIGAGRDAFRIHPDGGQRGTNGCVGVTLADTSYVRDAFRAHFAERTRLHLPDMALSVDASRLGLTTDAQRRQQFDRHAGAGPPGE